MLRRWLVSVLVLGLVAGAAGCADAASESGGTAPRVGFVPQNTRANYAVEMAEGFRSGVQRAGGVEAVVMAPDVVDGPAQLAMFQKLIREPIDAVAVHTAFGDLFAGPMSETVGKGVPVVSVDSRPPPSSGIKLYVGNDNRQLGHLLADLVIDKLPAEVTGTVVLGSTTPGTYALDQRSDGMREQLRRRLPGVKVVGPFETKRDPKVNLASWTTLVQANPKALAFLGTGNFDAVSLATLRARTKGSWQAGAFDLEPAALAAVKAGHLVLVSPEHYLKGAVTGRLMATYAKDRTALPAGWLQIPALAVTGANIDTVIARQATSDTKYAQLAPLVDKIIKDPAALRPL